jgi:hypothetical protein
MKRIFLSAVFLSVLAAGCGKTPLFDNLVDNNISVVIKGTYESNSPRAWLTPAVINDDNMTVLPPSGIVAATKPATYDNWPTQYMIDIAEIQINGERFANYRGVYNCAMTNTDPFFDGSGLSFKSDDVRTGRNYSSLELYLRKTVFDNAYSFYPVTGALYKTETTLFHEVTVNGYNFILEQVNSFYDKLKKNQSYINRVYPLSVPISGGFVYDNKNQYVLEVRVVVKNFLKRYESIKTTDSTIYSYHYFGTSDWLYDARGGDGYIGGNMIGVARWYIVGQTATVQGSVSASGWVVGIPAGDTASDYMITSAERTRPSDTWAPRNSAQAGSDIISLLDYYVDLQKHIEDYSLLYTAVTADTTSYATTWDTYNNKISSLKIPPLAVYMSSGGTFNITNVPLGQSYRLFYISDSGVTMGELPVPTGSGTVITVPASVPSGIYASGVSL